MVGAAEISRARVSARFRLAAGLADLGFEQPLLICRPTFTAFDAGAKRVHQFVNIAPAFIATIRLARFSMSLLIFTSWMSSIRRRFGPRRRAQQYTHKPFAAIK